MENDPTPNLLFPTCAECEAMGIPMPEMLSQMEAALGFDVFRSFLLKHSGQQLCIRVRPEGDAVQEWLNKNAGWGRIIIPRGPSKTTARAQWTALAMLREGRSLRETSRAVNVHHRTVSKWKTNFIDLGLLAGEHTLQPSLKGSLK